MKTTTAFALLLALVGISYQASGEGAGGLAAKTGQGEGVYQVVRGWGVYPEGKQFGSLHGDMAADSKGNVYLSAGDAIHVFGPDGKYTGNLGPDTGGVHGMKVRKQDGEEFLFIAQNGLKVVAKLKLDGTPVWRIEGHPKVEGMYPEPGSLRPDRCRCRPGWNDLRRRRLRDVADAHLRQRSELREDVRRQGERRTGSSTSATTCWSIPGRMRRRS